MVAQHLRAKLEEVQRLRESAHRLFLRNLEIYKRAEAKTRHLQEQLRQSHRLAQRHARQWTARRLRLLIGSRIDQGRLPDTISTMALGGPGFGSECEACDGYLPRSQWVMSIPKDESFVYVHAHCYAIWKAQCRLRAALRRNT